MRIVILTAGSRGDVQPYVGLGVGLQRAGHQVCLPAPETFRSLITQAGLEFVPVRGLNPQELLRLPEVQALVRKAGRPTALLTLLRIGQRYLADILDEYWCSSEGADLLVASTTAFCALDCAEKRGIKYIHAPQQPLEPTRAFPSPFLAPWGVRLDTALNRLTYYLLQFILWQTFRAAINNWRRQMSLPPHSAFGYSRWLQAQVTLCGFSPLVLPAPTDWPPHHHVTGYWFLDEPLGWQPPADLVRFLKSGRPPVYVGFGSLGEDDPTRMTRVVLEALELSDQRGVLLSGWSGLGNTPLPKTVYRLDSIPHSWLFPKMAAVVHHGGMGTTAAALRVGVPSVIIPIGGDQPFWAERVKQLGVGVRCAPFSKVTAEQLAAALDKATTDTTLRQQAAALGEKIRAEDGVGRAVALIQNYH
jgi:UDP:flavonoid glycosyltransferase YjiC (YdhE family)